MRSHNAAVRILVLDANERSALAAVRSLGRVGYTVLVADEQEGSLSGASRYCSEQLRSPSPYREPQRFVRWFTECYDRRQFHIALPMTEVTTDLLTRHRARWPELILPFASTDVIDELSDKVLLYQRALDLGVPVPDSVIVSSSSDLDSAIQRIGFPAFLKPRRSRLWTENGYLSTNVRKVETTEQLRAVSKLPEFRTEPFLYQKPALGSGRGIFALFDQGQPIAVFSHRRLREKPPEGGVSVLSESCETDPTLSDYAIRLLRSVMWHGVAMVEFKGDGAAAKLMEVNARFWGSLQLAIDAGVDFPVLLIDVALRRRPAMTAPKYRPGVRLRWLLGDLDRLYLIFKSNAPLKTKMRAAVEFLSGSPRRTRHEIFRWDDPQPALREALNYLRLN